MKNPRKKSKSALIKKFADKEFSVQLRVIYDDIGEFDLERDLVGNRLVARWRSLVRFRNRIAARHQLCQFEAPVLSDGYGVWDDFDPLFIGKVSLKFEFHMSLQKRIQSLIDW